NFFLGQFFRDNFEGWLSTLPQITSGVNITRVEVYLLNRNNDTQTLRDIVGVMDMGESDKIYRKDLLNSKVGAKSPTNNASNNLFDIILNGISRNSETVSNSLTEKGLVSGTDFERVTSARKLAATEFSVHKQLGYITLQRKLQNDEALAVAFEYTYNGRVYKVGELTEDYSSLEDREVIFLKLLRPRKINIKDRAGKIIPTWDLMMKNVYNLNVSQLTRDNFQLRIIYRDDRTGKDNPQLQDGDISRTRQLIQVFGLDRLNPYNDPQPDGNFDFVEGITINNETGLIVFPYLEPFNTPLKKLFNLESNEATKDFMYRKYLYDTLYRTTKAEAELVATKNKFFIVGQFKAGSGKEIIIQGFNITQGSVKVYAGGTPLIEGRDYTIDYTFGKVTILNDGVLSSGKDINITYEQQDPFAFQTRSLLGTRLDYKFSDDFNIGSTLLYYNERPLISRNLIGTEPARNFQYGLDLNYKKDSRILTKMVDALPFIQTKETSGITLSAEFAQLLPGTSNVVQGDGTSFIDDFENTATPYSLMAPLAWRLAATPKEQDFDESIGYALNDVASGYRRARLSWYQIDNLWYRQISRFKPDYLSTEVVNQNHYTRAVQQQEIFPGRDRQIGNFYEPIFDLAYYPAERGPYNYNARSTELTTDGFFRNPEKNWAGITTAIRNEVDWDKANVEYIEFWMLDPFIDDPKSRIDDGINPPKTNTTGGKLIFHMGSISEDVMRDGKHAFENGLPADGNLNSGETTQNEWGYVTTRQYINNAFDLSGTARKNQDVGLDGAGNESEAVKFKPFLDALAPDIRSKVQLDPSGDDFRYTLGSELDQKKAGLLERYKYYMGMENNSPVSSNTDAFPRSNYTTPDNEDLNQDNTLSDLEEYYTYSMDLKPGELFVGKKFIVDEIRPQASTLPPDVNPERWYLVRIPVRQFENKVGDINGFKSIRYVRMILTGFKEPIVLRLANFRAVGNRWRRYTANLEEARFGEPLEPNLDNFSVSVVNVEENSASSENKPPYVEPLRRDRDNTSTLPRRLNEQSVQLCINDLQDGDARAIYKNVSFDLFNYGRIKMFLSAYGEQGLRDDNLRAFVRLGTDFDQNYYEIDLPLKIIDPTDPQVRSRKVDAIWPEDNRIDLDLNELYGLKALRDKEAFPLGELFPKAGPRVVDGRQGIRMLGRPDLSQVRVIMIGVRNPTSPDKRNYDVCLWANELRLTDFDRSAGWAMNAVLNTKLADLGNVSGSFKHISFGYGGVQSKISERARGETNSYDISMNMNVEKLLPKWTGLKLPVFASFERTVVNPNFDPANPDLRIAAAFKAFNTDAEKKAYLDLIQDVSTRRSLNLTNFKRVKLDPKARSNIWDIENFSFTYAYSEATRTNFNLQENTQRNIRGGVAWQYNSTFKGFEPFKESKWAEKKSLQFIRDFNFNPLPASISIRGDLDRAFNKIIYRNASADAASSLPNFQKYFVFNRNYAVKWNLTKALGVDYNARVTAIIDEPDGDINTDSLKQVIKNNLKKLGRAKNFEQNITANYVVPFDKVPAMNWMGADYRYNVGYSWRAGPLEKADSLQLGNIIQNTSDMALTGKLDLLKLYNKSKYLKGVNTPRRKPTAAELAKKTKEKADTTKKKPEFTGFRGISRMLMSVRSINGTYNLTQGTILPGFKPSPYVLGLDKEYAAPGWNFIFGGQDPSIRFKARDNGWLSTSAKLTTPFSQTRNRDISLRASVEPAPDVRIQLDLKKSAMSSFQEIFRFDPDSSRFLSLSPSLSGSYKVSTITIKTAFRNNTSLTSTVFQEFEKNIGVMQDRFTAQTGNSYELKSQDVVIPAFLATYTGQSAKTTSLSPFPSLPLPNWRLDYAGLGKLEFFKDIFQSVTINHAYSSNYSVVNYSNSLEYTGVGINQPVEKYNTASFATQRTDQGKLIPVYVISQVMLSEQFAPLIGINVRTQSKVSIRFEYKTKRDLALNISNAQVTELNSKDWSTEVSFTKGNFKLPFKSQGRTLTVKNDLTFRLNMSVTNNLTIQRKIAEVNTITNGNYNFQLRPNISYVLNKKLSLQFYFERNTNTPYVSSAFPRATTRFGTKILFDLAQ
ncbi:MAG: cell surface protein SprA, partial [Bacteroidota bacterium]